MVKNTNKIYIGIVLFVLLLLVGFFINNIKQYNTINPGLVPPKNSYESKVIGSLSAENKVKYETEVQNWDEKIKTFIPYTGKEDIYVGTGKFGEATIHQTKVPAMWYIEKAKNLQYLGRYVEAINTFNEMFVIYKNSFVGWNNLGALYEEVGEDNLAIGCYKANIKDFPELSLEQYKKIASIYLRNDELRQAKTWYEKYRKNGGSPDSEFQDRLY